MQSTRADTNDELDDNLSNTTGEKTNETQEEPEANHIRKIIVISISSNLARRKAASRVENRALRLLSYNIIYATTQIDSTSLQELILISNSQKQPEVA